jgi:hypothetical protein
MQALHVVILQSDPETEKSLLARLSPGAKVAGSFCELRHRVAKHRPRTVVVDMEVVSIADLESLTHEFPGVRVVCNHRLADDGLWTATLGAGAAECCASSDIEGILAAVEERKSRSQAA